MDKAIPCGLIINELISNSLKHAFPDAGKGEIKIQINSVNTDQVSVQVKDNGIGMPCDIDIKNVDTLGLRLVNTLIDQLDGMIEINRNGGTEYKIIFKT